MLVQYSTIQYSTAFSSVQLCVVVMGSFGRLINRGEGRLVIPVTRHQLYLAVVTVHHLYLDVVTVHQLYLDGVTVHQLYLDGVTSHQL